MMVVHEDSETPVEVAIIRKPLLQKLEQKSYVIVRNHVRELIKDESESPVTRNQKSPQKWKMVRRKKTKSVKKSKKSAQTTETFEECKGGTNIPTGIDQNDLNELRSVYSKCKEVMRKIESKYGHFLDLDSEEGPSSCKKRRSHCEDSTVIDCYCKFNTKIVFDDEGKQSTVETVPEKHICAKKANKSHNEMQIRSKKIAIQYTEMEKALPDNLPELASLLQDQGLQKTIRHKIIEKMRMIKQEYVNDIKFNKYAIIEKIKANPDEVLDFKGTNLSSIPGYL